MSCCLRGICTVLVLVSTPQSLGSVAIALWSCSWLQHRLLVPDDFVLRCIKQRFVSWQCCFISKGDFSSSDCFLLLYSTAQCSVTHVVVYQIFYILNKEMLSQRRWVSVLCQMFHTVSTLTASGLLLCSALLLTVSFIVNYTAGSPPVGAVVLSVMCSLLLGLIIVSAPPLSACTSNILLLRD